MPTSDVKVLEARLAKLEKSHSRLQSIVHFYTFCLVALVGSIASLLWYAKNQYMPHLATVVSSVRTLNGLFRERTSSLSPGIDSVLDYLERFLGR